MSSLDALSEMLKRSGMSKYALSKALGRSTTYISTTMQKGGDIGAENLARMAEVMGFRLVLDGKGEPIEVTPRSKEGD